MKITSLRKTQTETLDGVTSSIEAIVKDDSNENHVVNISEDHPSWHKANQAIENFTNSEKTDEDKSELAKVLYSSVNLIDTVEEKLVKVQDILDGRMNISGNKVTIDHEPVDQSLEAHIIRLLNADGTPKDARNWRAFALFVENLYSNMSEYVRKQLFGWLNYENLNGLGFTLTDDGCFIGYKGCDGTPEEPYSRFAGYAIVDGKPMNGKIPNKVGSVIEMPRNQVTDNPEVGCSTGLHVGTYSYASSWANGVLLTVKVNPRDVVSVPVECDAQKIRTCRYEILEVTETEKREDLLWESDDNDYCDYCGESYNYCECEDDSENKYCDNLDCGCRRDKDSYDGQDVEDETVDYDYDPYDNIDDVKENDVIEFKYSKLYNPNLKHYSIEVTKVEKNHIHGDKTESGEHRTFIKDRIIDLKIINSSDGETHMDDETNMRIDLKSLSLNVGDRVSVTYFYDETRRKYDGTIVGITNDKIEIRLSAPKVGYRSLFIDRIEMIEKIDPNETKTETKETHSENSNENDESFEVMAKKLFKSFLKFD